MASYLSTYLSKKILDFILTHTAYSPPATLYFALFTVRPAADGTGGTEVTIGSNNYSRLAVLANTYNFPGASVVSGIENSLNGAILSFATPSGAWGTVVAIAILDASTAGNFLWIGDLASSISPTSGIQPAILIGKLAITQT